MEKRTLRKRDLILKGKTMAQNEIHTDNSAVIEVLRAEEEWQRAGAYMVRIQGMNRQYHIPLQEEIDKQDGAGTRYIVLLDDGYPIATCRFYEADERRVSLGRVVVLPEYRGQACGARLLKEAEDWIRERGYEEILVDSRVTAIGFYEKYGYETVSDSHYMSGPFECVRMHKKL